ncbi:chemotaxis protein CheX [Halalkalibacter alkaliphilus]|uniref:Chemotaxis protein CheX n=1 Tax=Halalkalibacter alkaliphilus TaxID=2917993 RepID=A0A9X1ZZZ2_9BACI|nr:chemotaxis protein CheX [Halalkalibacter alkaliphilus]MCL7746707.1 chemotaxis protein CheX [Halalkalibacter alkaliphilus]
MISLLDLENQYNLNLTQGVVTSMKHVVPLHVTNSFPQVTEQSILVDYGVFIELTGDIKGKLVLCGEIFVFSAIGQSMFGIPIEGEMLDSFIGELGNMIAGSFSTIIAEYGINTDITAPLVMKKSTVLTKFEKGMQVPITFEGAGEINVYLLID